MLLYKSSGRCRGRWAVAGEQVGSVVSLATGGEPDEMKFLKSVRELVPPEGVKVEVQNRDVTVTGPRGKLFRSFKSNRVDIVLEGMPLAARPQQLRGGDVLASGTQ